MLLTREGLHCLSTYQGFRVVRSNTSFELKTVTEATVNIYANQSCLERVCLLALGSRIFLLIKRETCRFLKDNIVSVFYLTFRLHLTFRNSIYGFVKLRVVRIQ